MSCLSTSPPGSHFSRLRPGKVSKVPRLSVSPSDSHSSRLRSHVRGESVPLLSDPQGEVPRDLGDGRGKSVSIREPITVEGTLDQILGRRWKGLYRPFVGSGGGSVGGSQS